MNKAVQTAETERYRSNQVRINGGGGIDTAPIAGGKAKEKAVHGTRRAVRLPREEQITAGFLCRFGRCLTVCRRHMAPGMAAENGKDKRQRWKHAEQYGFLLENNEIFERTNIIMKESKRRLSPSLHMAAYPLFAV